MTDTEARKLLEKHKRHMASVRLENSFAFQLRARRIDGWSREYKFHPKRKWRFDFAWPELQLAVEVDGGVYSGGRHTRGKGFERDCEKMNEAALLGWTVLRGSGGMVKDRSLITITEQVHDRIQRRTREARAGEEAPG